MSLVLGVRWQIILTILQCETTLNSWRSDIGKAGHHAVVELINLDPLEFDTVESCKQYVANAIDRVHFIYRYPNELVCGLVTNRNRD